MFAEVVMHDYILRRWRLTPDAPKRLYEAIAAWQAAIPENDRPLSQREVNAMKAWMKLHAPTSYFEIFPEEREE